LAIVVQSFLAAAYTARSEERLILGNLASLVKSMSLRKFGCFEATRTHLAFGKLT
jgi:hypothetical protein